MDPQKTPPNDTDEDKQQDAGQDVSPQPEDEASAANQPESATEDAPETAASAEGEESNPDPQPNSDDVSLAPEPGVSDDAGTDEQPSDEHSGENNGDNGEETDTATAASEQETTDTGTAEPAPEQPEQPETSDNPQSDDAAVADEPPAEPAQHDTGADTAGAPEEEPASDTADPATGTAADAAGGQEDTTSTAAGAAAGAVSGAALGAQDTSGSGDTDADSAAASDMQSGAVVTDAPHKRKKALIAILVVAVALLLLGGGAAWAYVAHYLPNRPENVLKSAFTNSVFSEDMNSVSFEGEFNTSSADGDAFSGTFAGIVGDDGSFDVSTDIDATVTTITIDARSTSDDNIYLRASGLDGLPELLAATDDPALEMYAGMVSHLDNQWVVLNSELLDGVVDDPIVSAQNQLAAIAGLYEEHPFLVVREVLPDEQINGIDSHHYKVGIDETELEAFTRAVNDADIEGLATTEEDLQRSLDAIQEANFDDNTVDVWIAKDAKRFTQFAVATTSEEGTELTMRMSVTGYNEPVEIEQPQNAQTLLEVFGGMFGGELGGAMQGDMDALFSPGGDAAAPENMFEFMPL